MAAAGRFREVMAGEGMVEEEVLITGAIWGKRWGWRRLSGRGAGRCCCCGSCLC